MNKPEIDPNHIVVFTGAGISADQLATFTDDNGLWLKYRIEEVSSAHALKAYPEKVIDFYNFRKQEVLSAHPNPAHIAIAELEKKYRVSVVTSNVDNLHERAGSTQVYHVHGSLFEARHVESDVSFSIGDRLYSLENNERPHVVLYGERVPNLYEVKKLFKTASKVLIIGTFLTVKPVCNLPKYARGRAEKILVSKHINKRPYGFEFIPLDAIIAVPLIVKRWLNQH